MSALYDIFHASTGVTTDSRTISEGSLFFALRGASFDGNRFAIDALHKGASVAVVDDATVIENAPEELAERLFLVENTLTALQDLAREHREVLGIPILSVAGSNGKTTTKELVARVLAEKYEVYATRGNLNNHIGVPLTLLAMDQTTEFGVVEMGASACGEIALLASIAKPNYGILTNIGRSHLEGFGGVEGIRRGKGELFDYLNATGGRAFVPSDDEVLSAMAAERENMAVEYFAFATSNGVEHQLEGDYNLKNIAAAMSIGRYFDVDEQRIRHAIATYTPTNNRSQRTVTDHNILIIDCYNANPSSMRASLESFLAEKSELPRMCILGDMLELGEWSAEEHRAILELVVAGDFERIWLVGKHFTEAAATIGNDERVSCFTSREEVADRLTADPIKGALVLVKGSHSIGLEKLIPLL
ncbi:MAG: UDP-N-acetylmuramoyl-tripeptide--D-alanyl-D-alanine ligase [Rikenellaceae bacterium]|nr:UDP-N-acetylmuramoyl-tripeptide--D-alanyl-D-alanine ligase [Rikenellaceae bacterium]MBR2419158.1 UDP-N-acetylmuramoyl-tripeptide--D-alanyl-D-alanine ligase [Rikenellaceae bacterium]MBR3800864.1 UDP-N-acetylmuramoyl-tripeptide--D-alanyl-D-alanine ligase [Rikenellaceae bacterium]